MSRLSQKDDEDSWLSISDLMSGIMIVFLLFAIMTCYNYVNELKKSQELRDEYQQKMEYFKEKMEECAALRLEHQKQIKDIENVENRYKDRNKELNEALHRKFDPVSWRLHIEIDDDNTIRFLDPDGKVFFAQGSDALTPAFKKILDEFFQEYINVLLSHKSADGSEGFAEKIDEIRIEGHTSSEWGQGVSLDEAYVKNMELSQDRTRNVLNYCLGLLHDSFQREEVKKRLTANGLSSSRLITKKDQNGNTVEDSDRSRRVEFRVMTNDSEKQLVEILDILKTMRK